MVACEDFLPSKCKNYRKYADTLQEEVMTTGLLREPDQVSGRVAWT